MSELSPLEKALADVLSGTKQAHQVGEVLVRAAVAETLARVCADHPLDYGTLLRKHEDSVVKTCCSACVADGFAQCEAVTQTKKRCRRRAVIGGFCTTHLPQWTDRLQTSKALEAYETHVKPVGGKKRPKVALTDLDILAVL